ncbi:hypothetical protein VZC37_13395 [Gordonia sp. LSe1-13]|uniref:Uncharacterized protein n=1 Tax=Gordonia sesuvii TaxID=3116777 RepID=A0ABU7ME08_9ACTN|nr:hypothetical protein [Gordonia sp. LSe1-13]
MSADDRESHHETIYWRSRPGAIEAIGRADDEHAAGETISLDELREEHGLPPRRAK